MPWTFSTLGSSLSCGLAFVGFVVGGLRLIIQSLLIKKISVGVCLILGVSGLLLTYADWSYLSGLAEERGVSSEWSPLESIPENLIEPSVVLGQDAQLKGESTQRNLYVPGVTKLNRFVLFFQIRLAAIALGLVAVIVMILQRYKSTSELSVSSLLDGLPLYIFGAFGILSTGLAFIPNILTLAWSILP